MSRTYDVQKTDQAILLLESAEIDPWHVREMKELAHSAKVKIVGEFISRTRRRTGQGFISEDRRQELALLVPELDANVILVAHDLSPTQHSLIQKATEVRVVDRTQLILDIFAQRAHTREGKLQVEHALLSYTLPRLSGLGSQMSRLGGGVGTRGPGETKLETDRRRLRKRIESLASEIDTIKKHREVARASRHGLTYPNIALVGYTSAGKSTLLNTLSGSSVMADQMLFSTLDPTTRKVALADGWSALITDTVGFIRDLPHALVAAFRATLEEVREADILLHLVDASHPSVFEMIESVESTLEELEASEKPTILVFNKADLVADTYWLREEVAKRPNSCYISAQKGQGIRELMVILEHAVEGMLHPICALVPYSRSDLVSGCYEHGRVLNADYQDDGIYLEAEVDGMYLGKLSSYILSK